MCRIKLRSKCPMYRKGPLLLLIVVYVPSSTSRHVAYGDASLSSKEEIACTGEGVMAIIIQL